MTKCHECSAVVCLALIALAGWSGVGTGSAPASRVALQDHAGRQTGTVVDADGNVYKTVKIGDQWWMAENLRVTHDPQGKPIKSYIFDNKPENEAVYGRLYSWDVAMNGSTQEKAQGIAPDGWHIPDDADWDKLFETLGGKSAAGGKMKEKGTAHWQAPNTGATNLSGFSGLPAGGYSMGLFEGLGVGTHYWSSTGNGPKTSVPSLHSESEEALRFEVPKTFCHSVRCVKDIADEKK